MALAGVGEALGHKATFFANASDPGKELLRVGLHGTIGGLAPAAGGGSFGSGFLAAGFSALAGPLVRTGDGIALGTAKSA